MQQTGVPIESVEVEDSVLLIGDRERSGQGRPRQPSGTPGLDFPVHPTGPARSMHSIIDVSSKKRAEGWGEVVGNACGTDIKGTL